MPGVPVVSPGLTKFALRHTEYVELWFCKEVIRFSVRGTDSEIRLFALFRNREM
jgi:hypothetical protein